MNNLIATYRIQFHKDFSFDEFEKVLPYLRALGVPTIYASPVFKAIPGSTHGYDGLHPHQINPEIGTLEQLEEISARLKTHGMNWLQDIVPNHMAFHTANEWLMDVLENGQASEYAGFFDIDWEHPDFFGKLDVPFLGDQPDAAIRNGNIQLAYSNGRLVLQQGDSHYPINRDSYRILWDSENTPKELESIKKEWSEKKPKASRKEFEKWADEKGKAWLQRRLDEINKDQAMLTRIMNEQHYVLSYWQDTQKHINYRRFFIVNSLISLNIHDPAVFALFHQLIAELVEKKVITGLRIDHIDGLYDPTQYLERLRQLIGPDMPVVVEKILEPGEDLPAYWPIEGNTGYDFLSLVNNLLTNSDHEDAFTSFYKRIDKNDSAFYDQLHEKKAAILYGHMNGELDNLVRLFKTLGLEKEAETVSDEVLRKAIGTFLVYCPVYRFYGKRIPLEEGERQSVSKILDEATAADPSIAAGTQLLRNVFVDATDALSERQKERVAHFYRRCMQFTGPLMAKGLEDTLMYTDHRFIAHNEVGDAPNSFGIHTKDFHDAMVVRAKKWPYSLNATATHDTKRGEDVRARLNALSDLPEEWMAAVEKWKDENKALRKEGTLDSNDEYLIYQTLIGAVPMPGQEDPDFITRIHDYLQKALREAKKHSNWENPNEQYEQSAKQFAEKLMTSGSGFRKSLDDLLFKIADHGIINSLVQTVLKFTTPGIPDTYQGTELWDLSLVDPDNRRPVDYGLRAKWLREVEGKELQQLWGERYGGKIKLALVQRLFKLRMKEPKLWAKGKYIPLEVTGTYNRYILAFARKLGKKMEIVAVPLHTAVICKEQSCDPLSINWKDTKILKPANSGSAWLSMFSGVVHFTEEAIPVAECFKKFPIAILHQTDPPGDRGAGVLMHISSLPSAFGTGDAGPEAYAFAEFLQRSGQKYWQMLPINPIEEGQGFSPYSSTSSRAGNVLFISPELLVKEGLLDGDVLSAFRLPITGKSDYEGAGRVRGVLLEQAWKKFNAGSFPELTQLFKAFCTEENEWLDDFALFTLFKEINKSTPWYDWPADVRDRNPKAIDTARSQYVDKLEFIKWQQFIFFHQWHQLKKACNEKAIALIGDLPFYVSRDSVDVWSHREMFLLDEQGEPIGVAGVPPDAFSETGQLWGMPVFNWKKLEETGYRWWIDRLKKNMSLFDLVRLDHFRAFSAYWEVPGSDITAQNGTWTPGPGARFFEAAKKELGHLPFIAEDLGEIDEPVYELRDEFGMKGMKVLQFAFHDTTPQCIHIPHNYTAPFVAYTGTHDNNTTRGWFKEEAGDVAKKMLRDYLGTNASESEVAPALIRLAYASVASIVIIPMQDILNQDGKARMNLPATVQGNWSWRISPGELSSDLEKRLRNWAFMYDRAPS